MLVTKGVLSAVLVNTAVLQLQVKDEEEPNEYMPILILQQQHDKTDKLKETDSCCCLLVALLGTSPFTQF